jgi:hypothetical protein
METLEVVTVSSQRRIRPSKIHRTNAGNMEVKKVEVWGGETATHGFSIDVFRNTKAGLFIAMIHTYSPPSFSEYFPSANTTIHHDEPEELKHHDLDQLREATKQRITNRCGKIKNFDSRVL